MDDVDLASLPIRAVGARPDAQSGADSGGLVGPAPLTPLNGGSTPLASFQLILGEPVYALPEGLWPKAEVLWQRMLPPHPRLHSGHQFTWEYAGRKHGVTWGFECEADRYGYLDALGLLPRRINTQSHIYYALNDPYMEAVCGLADSLLSLHGGPPGADLAGFLLAFVQSIRYLNDPPARTGDLPAFCSECLARPGGDCEDTSILLAALLVRFGMDAAFLYMDGHMAIGIAGPFKGESVWGAGHRYYYAETAVENGYSEIGEVRRESALAFKQARPIVPRDLGLPAPVRVLAADLDYGRGELRVVLVSRLDVAAPLRVAMYARLVHATGDGSADALLVGAADIAPPPESGNLILVQMPVDLGKVPLHGACLDVTAWCDGQLVGRWPTALKPAPMTVGTA